MSVFQETPGVAEPMPEQPLSLMAEGTARRSIGWRGPQTMIGKVILGGHRWSAFALLFLYPFAWLLSASFKPRGEVFDNKLIPETFVPQNYVEVWNQLPLTELDVQQHRDRAAGRDRGRGVELDRRVRLRLLQLPGTQACCSAWCSPR